MAKVLSDVRIIHIGKGILVGTFAGFIVSIFRLIIEHVLEYIKYAYQYLNEEPQWIIVWAAASAIAAIFVGYLVKSEPNIKGSGIPQVEGQLQGQIQCNWWSVLWKKFIGGLFSIGAGLFLGREGPSIQLGAAVGQGVNQLFKGNRMQEKVLISSGASAGLSAAFNAPMAGLLFVLEEVHHNFSPLVGLTSLSAAVTANFISMNIFGLTPALNIGSVKPFPLKGYIYLIILGVILGIFGLLYDKVLLALPKIYGKLRFLPSHLYGIIPFMLVIPIGIMFPKVLGGGSDIVLSLGQASPALTALFGLFVIRFVFSMVSYGGNLPGGIFLPILSLGAILGSIYGNIVINLTDIEPIYIRSFIIFAMAGYFTAIGKAPLTAIVLVTEMVGNLDQLMPLAVVSLVSYIVVDLMGAKPIYESLLERLINNTKTSLIGRKEFIEVPVHAESILDGKMIRDCKWPEDTLITSIRRGGKEIIARGDTVIYVGDCLIISTDEGIASGVHKQIKQMSECSIYAEV